MNEKAKQRFVNSEKYYKIVNIALITRLCGIQKDKVFNNFKGQYITLSKADKKNIFSILYPAVKKVFLFIDKMIFSEEEHREEVKNKNRKYKNKILTAIELAEVIATTEEEQKAIKKIYSNISGIRV